MTSSAQHQLASPVGRRKSMLSPTSATVGKYLSPSPRSASISVNGRASFAAALSQGDTASMSLSAIDEAIAQRPIDANRRESIPLSSAVDVSDEPSLVLPPHQHPLTQAQQVMQLQLIQKEFLAAQQAEAERRAHLTSSSVVPPIASKAAVQHANVQYYDDDIALQSLTPRTIFDSKRRTISRLTLNLIMTLTIDQIRAIRAAFDRYDRGVTMTEFVQIVTTHLYNDTVAQTTSPSLFIHALIELFEAMDLDGDQSLEWEELLSTIVHMGMGATDHLVLSPINPYRLGPIYYGSKQTTDRHLSYHPGLHKLIFVELQPFSFKMHDPSMRGTVIHPRITQSSVLCVEYVHGYGELDEERIGGSKQSLSHESKHESSSLRDHIHSNKDNEMKRRNEQQKSASKMSQKVGGGSSSSSSGSNSNNNNGMHDDRHKYDHFAFYKHTLKFDHNNKNDSNNNNNANTRNNSNNNNKNNKTSSKDHNLGSVITDPHSGEHYHIWKERSTGSRFGNDDLVVTSTSQYLSLWEGLPEAEVVLCDSKKVRAPYSALKWCRVTQRLFAGDIAGNVHSWRIVNVLLDVTDRDRWQNNAKRQTQCKLVRERAFNGHSDAITTITTIPSLAFLLTASLDHTVRMWDINDGSEKNIFIGHRAGVVDVCYSNEYRFLLSASIDHDVCVWSPFAQAVVFKLTGHTSPLVGVQFVTGTPQIVTADSEGFIKVWDARNFTCCQTFTSLAQMTSFTTCGDRHARLFVCGRNRELYTYDQEGGPYLKATDDDPIYTAIYSTLNMSFLTCNRQDIKMWNGLNGKLSRVYRGLSDTHITAICLDSRQRKLFVGDREGKIRVYNALTGAYMKRLSPHSEEIIFLEYCLTRRELVSASTDRHVKVHDERPIEEQIVVLDFDVPDEVELLGVAVSQTAHMAAVAGSDGIISVWSIEHGIKDEIHKTHHEVISAIIFLDPFPLVLVGDEAANIACYAVRPSHVKGEVIFGWALNKDANEINGAITILKWHADTQSVWVGNIHGQVIGYDLTEIISTAMADMAEKASDQWNKKLFDMTVARPVSHASKKSSRATTSHGRHARAGSMLSAIQSAPFVCTAVRALIQSIRPMTIIDAYKHAISSITFSPQPRALITTARMHKVKLWAFNGDLLGLMDSQQALAATYAKQADEQAFIGATQWKFVVDVAAKAEEEQTVTEHVLCQLEEQQRAEDNAEMEEKENFVKQTQTGRKTARISVQNERDEKEEEYDDATEDQRLEMEEEEKITKDRIVDERVAAVFHHEIYKERKAVKLAQKLIPETTAATPRQNVWRDGIDPASGVDSVLKIETTATPRSQVKTVMFVSPRTGNINVTFAPNAPAANATQNVRTPKAAAPLQLPPLLSPSAKEAAAAVIVNEAATADDRKRRSVVVSPPAGAEKPSVAVNRTERPRGFVSVIPALPSFSLAAAEASKLPKRAKVAARSLAEALAGTESTIER